MQRIDRVRITTSAGERHEIVAIMLYPGPRIAESLGLRADAEGRLAEPPGWSAVPHTLPWELGGAMLASVLEYGSGLGRSKAALELLRRADEALIAARRHGRMFPVHEIENGRFPAPNLWAGEAGHEATKRGLLGTSTERSSVRFVHDGSPFVRVKHESGEISFLVWEVVAEYAPGWEVPRPDED